MTRFPLFLLAALIVAARPAATQTPLAGEELESTTRQVASELRCPVCQGLSIQDSPSELAQQMKAVIRDQLATGSTPAEVKAYFVGRYGEWVLLEPKAAGFNLAIYLLPLLVIVGGALFVLFTVRRWVRPATDASPGMATPESPPSTPVVQEDALT